MVKKDSIDLWTEEDNDPASSETADLMKSIITKGLKYCDTRSSICENGTFRYIPSSQILTAHIFNPHKENKDITMDEAAERDKKTEEYKKIRPMACKI